MTDAANSSQTQAASLPPHETGFGTKAYRSYVLGSLLLVYIFNFIDRTIINILTEPIKNSFGVEDWQMGLLGGPAFAILYTMLGIPIARFSERSHRVGIIAAAVVFWSLMTVLCGFATTFLMLFLFRIGVLALGRRAAHRLHNPLLQTISSRAAAPQRFRSMPLVCPWGGCSLRSSGHSWLAISVGHRSQRR